MTKTLKLPHRTKRSTWIFKKQQECSKNCTVFFLNFLKEIPKLIQLKRKKNNIQTLNIFVLPVFQTYLLLLSSSLASRVSSDYLSVSRDLPNQNLGHHPSPSYESSPEGQWREGGHNCELTLYSTSRCPEVGRETGQIELYVCNITIRQTPVGHL